jgi:RNA polymerase sigma factor (sigma-70 family)
MSAARPISPSRSVEDLLARQEGRLKALFRRYSIPAQDTEDILQQALLALIYQWDQIRQPEAWLFATLRNHCRRYWRDRRRRFHEAMDEAVLECLAEPQPPEQERQAFRRDLDEVLARLPQRCSHLLRLRYQLGYAPPEVAALMGYSPKSIGKLTRRCLATLTRELLQTDGD